MEKMASVSIKRNLYISLFEPQLIRSYLLAENSNILVDLNQEFNVYIITSSQLEHSVNQGIAKASLHGLVQIIRFDKYRDTKLTRLLSFVLFWSNQSPALNLKISRLLHEDHKIFLFIFRLFVNKFSPKSDGFIKLMRLCYLKSMKNNTLAGYFSRSIAHNDSDLVFITSLTNSWEDIQVAIYFKKYQARIIGTVRSWDNLTNHGYLKFLPDIFIFHSEAMENFGKNFQRMAHCEKKCLVSPVYQDKYWVRSQVQSLELNSIAYMCMGKVTNPDDENFVRWLIEKWSELPENFRLTIVQHPNFLINIDDSNLTGSINFKTFHYSNSNLTDYYNFIAQQDLIICGGTTAALDSAFLNTPIAIIGFEIKQQNYSTSALRYFDVKPHTKNFFNDCKVLIVSDKQDLLNTVKNLRKIPALEVSKVSFYTGRRDIDFNGELINAMKEFH